MNCPDCNSNQIIKNGKRAGSQQYLCKTCNRQFTEGASPHGRTGMRIARDPRSYRLGGRLPESLGSRLEELLKRDPDETDTEFLERVARAAIAAQETAQS